MPTDFCDHEENRLKVCGPCGKKIIFGSKKLSSFKINNEGENLIQKHVNESFKLKDSKYPLSWCHTCRVTVKEHENGITKRPLIKMPNYEEMQLQKDTRKDKGPCNCYVCLTARSKVHKKDIVGKGNERKFEIKINADNGLYAASSNQKSLKSSNVSESFEVNDIKMCTICLGKIGKGVRHECNKENVLVDNVHRIVMNLPEKVQDKIVHSILKEKIEKNDESSNSLKNTNLKLHTPGRHDATICLNPKENKDIVFSAEKLDNLQNNMRFSSTKMRYLENFIRCNAGRKSIPSNYRDHAIENGKVLKDVYKVGSHVFDVEGVDTKKNRPIVYADCEELLEAVVDYRNLIGDYYIKIMADSGQGFFKISMSLFTKNEDEGDADTSSPTKRAKYSEGGRIGKNSSLTSVYKIIIICIVPKIKESYDNLLYVCNLINLNKLPFKFASDLKLLLTVNGQQTASSMYPCPYCFISLRNLKKGCKEFVDVNNQIVLSSSISTLSSEQKDIINDLKTYGNLEKDYKKYVNDGNLKKNAINCHSTVNKPIFQENNDVKVIEKCVVPELHLLEGFVNHLFWKGLVPLVGRETALTWPKKLKVVPKNYQGELFEGNACRKLLKHADKLYDKEIVHSSAIKLRLEPFVASLKIMNDIVHSCFSMTRTKTILDIEKSIGELNKAFDATDVSESLKMHIILNHLLQCLECLDEKEGFGLWSEQAGESIHHEFLIYWNRYKINSMEDPSYVFQLQMAVVEFSSRHL